jgi:hypothetical protein
MVQWDFSLEESTEQQTSRRVEIAKPRANRVRRTGSRPLVEPQYNAHLIHTGRRAKSSVTVGSKKLRIRRVVKNLP